MTFEATITDLIRQDSADIVFMGTGGRLNIFRYGYKYLPAEKNMSVGKMSGGESAEVEPHMANWFECMRSRKKAIADEYAGHYSSLACHVGNLAYQKKARVEWQKEWEV